MVTNPKKEKIDISELIRDDFTPYKEGKICSEAFEKAIAEYSKIYVPAGKYYIDRSLVIGSDTMITAHENAEIILVKGCKTLLLRNASVIDGSERKIGSDASCDRDITIKGGVWGEENTKRLGYGASGCYDENDGMHGVSTCFLFSGVKNLTIENVVFRSTAGLRARLEE